MIRRARQFPELLVLAGVILVHLAMALEAAAKRGAATPTGKAGKERQVAAASIEPCKTLPAPVKDMRDGILAAVRSGDVKELLVPIQWNELSPDFGEGAGSDPIAFFKKQSVDGEGREILAILGNLLSVPCAVVRSGPDIENNKVYVWPYFARMPFATLKPAEIVVLLSVVPRDSFAAMKAAGGYQYWSLSVGADGTWHSFKKTENQK
jgi:hypothetical protein